MSFNIELFSESVSSLDNHLKEDVSKVRRSKSSSKLISGSRVRLKKSSEVCFTYNLSEDFNSGTIIKVRTSSGDTTNLNGRFFVLFDQGEVRPILSHHLERIKQSSISENRRVVSSLGDLTDFIKKGTPEELVHKATKDLWSVSKKGNDFVIERLFEQTGEPLKV